MCSHMKYTGKLIYDDQGDYILQLDTEWGVFNISKILRFVYYHPKNNSMSVKIMKGTKTLFNEQGNLLLKKIIEPKLVSYHINGNDLETILFFNVGECLEVTIDAPAFKGENYGTKTVPK